MTRKKSRKQIRKAFNGIMKESEGDVNVGKGLKQKVRLIEKVPLEQDEFTEHKELKSILAKFVMEARDAQSHYQTKIKQMVREVALSLEEKLIEMHKPESICHISEELVSTLKQHKIRWNAIYIRRCLEEKYKDPRYRIGALALHEKKKKENVGVAHDSGRTVEEIEEALKPQLESKVHQEQLGLEPFEEDATVKSTFSHEYFTKVVKDFGRGIFHKHVQIEKNEDGLVFIINTPIIVKVNPKDRNITVDVNNVKIEEMDSLDSQEKLERKSKSEKQEKEQSNHKSKPKKGKKKPVTEMTEMEQRQAMLGKLNNLASDRGLI